MAALDRTLRSALHAVAEPQLGLFTTQQALALNLTRRQIEGLHRRREITAVRHDDHRLLGTWRFSGSPYEWPAPVMAACLAVGGGAVACLDTALQLHGLREPTPGVIHVCRPARWQPTVPGISVHTTRDLIDGDHTEVDGVSVTTPARTTIDMARILDRAGRLGLVDEVVFGGHAARQWLYRRASALHNGRTGVLDIVRATAPGAEAEFRSWLERQTSLAFEYWGVPAPAWNVPLHDAKGRIGIVDCLWSYDVLELVVELEGLRFHTTPKQRRSDAARFNRLSRRGPVLRYTWQDVVERPEAMCAEILDVLRPVRGAVDLPRGRG